jgi:hypothetical protein
LAAAEGAFDFGNPAPAAPLARLTAQAGPAGRKRKPFLIVGIDKQAKEVYYERILTVRFLFIILKTWRRTEGEKYAAD